MEEKKQKIFQIPSQITSVRPLADKSASITLHTNEVKEDEMVMLIRFLNKSGWMLFKEDKAEFLDDDVPEEESGFDDVKSPSERLRGVQFRFWKQELQTKYPDFETWRRMEMERLIGKYKERLV